MSVRFRSPAPNFAMKYFLILFSLLLFSGCATVPEAAGVYAPPPLQAGVAGLYHTVSDGETLWRIAKLYNVEIDEIIRVNNIANGSKIEKGQKLLIPRITERIHTRRPASGPVNLSGLGFKWPLKGKVVTYFGQKVRNVTSGGIDILCEGGASVAASKDGVVLFCDDKVKGLGKTIIIDHGMGYSTVYAHNLQNLVSPGEAVKTAQVIATVGKNSRSGDNVLHFEIRKRHKPQDPFYYLP